MGKHLPPPATGWIQDGTTLLYHYYEEEPGMAAHPSLCAKTLLVTATVRRKAGELPEGLKPRYVASNKNQSKRDGLCMACANRHANRK